MRSSFVFLAVSIAASFAFPATLSAAAERKMNVLFIISDDLRTELGAFGSERAQTPNIDRLASQGVAFQRAYCQYPLCNPSRTSMLTGRHPTTTNVYGNRDWFKTDHPDWVSLPGHFKQQGYRTLRTGKIFHGGIDDTDAWTEGGERRIFGEDAPTPAAPNRGAAPVAPASGQSRAARSDRWEAVEGPAVDTQGDTLVGNEAIEYLRAHRQATNEQPFFLAVGFSKPHSPLVAPKRFFDQYPLDQIELPVDYAPRPTVPDGFPAGSIRPRNADLFIGRDSTPEQAREMIRAYLACVSYVDWNVGRVLAELDALGLRESTIVVFWGDHGYQLGEKGKWSKAGSLWEQGARVPLIIHDPRARGNGTDSPRVVQSIDLYPTLADLCGLPHPDGVDGLSLVALLQHPEAEWNHPAFTVWNERNQGLTGVAVRTERWRYAEFFGRGAGAMLTDPIADPHELKNLAEDPAYAGVVAELAPLIARYAEGKTEDVLQGTDNR